MKVKDLIKKLQTEYDPECEVVDVIWDEDDVHEKASELGIELNPHQLTLIINHLIEEHDANYGIDLDTIELAIKRYA